MGEYKVLVVDDVERNIQVLANILIGYDIDVEFATNGYEAIEWVKSEKFDLVLMDVMMPDLDGFSTCEIIKSTPETKDIPIIFLTAKNDIESITRGFNLGGVDYITKPFNREELVSRVMTHLQLQSQKKQLIEMNSTKDKFFSIIAHDLVNPIAGFKNLLELMKSDYDTLNDEERHEIIDTIYNSSDYLLSLLDNLLVWSRSQRGAIEYEPMVYSVNSIINNVFNQLKLNASQKRIKLISEVDNKYSVFVDPNMITLVFRNIISNAIKFSNPDSNIKISASESGKFLKIAITDEGVGMNREVLDKLFRIDSTVSTVGTSNEKGTGLGLILCKEFVHKHGGNIWAESQIGKGSTFTFTLPFPEI